AAPQSWRMAALAAARCADRLRLPALAYPPGLRRGARGLRRALRWPRAASSERLWRAPPARCRAAQPLGAARAHLPRTAGRPERTGLGDVRRVARRPRARSRLCGDARPTFPLALRPLATAEASECPSCCAGDTSLTLVVTWAGMVYAASPATSDGLMAIP